MKKGKRGFTLVEVSIFLAITGVLFMAVTVGVRNSVYQQRNNDAVQNFMEFLRKAYSETTNVQNNKGSGGGRTEKAIYGKLITFGEKYNLAGDQTNGGEAGNEIFMYTVVGDVMSESSGGSAIDLLAGSLKASIAESNGESLNFAALAESYTPKWSATIEPACSDSEKCYKPLEGMLLIVRHPSSGEVYTYFTNDLVQVNQKMKENRQNLKGGISAKTDWLDFKVFKDKNESVDFCVNSSGESFVYFRNDVRINAGAKNASGIELIADEDNKCIRK